MNKLLKTYFWIATICVAVSLLWDLIVVSYAVLAILPLIRLAGFWGLFIPFTSETTVTIILKAIFVIPLLFMSYNYLRREK